MKILYLHQHFSTPKGATGIRSFEMAKALIANGHQVTMICGSYSGGNTGLHSSFVSGQRSGSVNNIHVIEFELNYANAQSFMQRSITFLKFAYQSIKMVMKQDYDLVIATSTPLTAAIPGLVARWLKRKTFIFEVRDLWPELPKAMGVIKNPLILSAMSCLEWLAYRSAHGHIGLSPGIVNGIKRHLPNKSHTVALIPNGCDLNIFSPTESWQPEGIADDDFVAVFSGTHGQANGLSAVINVAEELQEKTKKVKFILIGQGKLKSDLIAQAHYKKLTNVIFIDPVEKETLAKLFVRANVGLQVLANIPAFYDGTSPNKFFDYIAAGLPVINNYPGWLAKEITTKQCGIAVPPENSNAFSQAILQLVNNPEQCKAMSRNAKQLAMEKYARDILSTQFVDYIEKVFKTHD
ncbi:glycosyltransferase family 4 protein [Thalassotalea sp. PP2-459]|uniref:glycosyltransferase family 4 protein n=1 Tax=Thalassotalea sp. PP2-459 TaxID=1742724 RepID=UPI000941D6BD|nr:glycosyltransferase family 4 protein [Thalassotalea sp. PP2-459]OKY26751.1 glycosyltransferase WbuB [Thalassotalea sp. PP2-459]